ncbi:protein O-linked-mannose beta-1,4-N-acetylglucosaminyltransferase 2 [Lethenteron reissneri]|uniref:protein O-linked-mannose beta-1,4-N-acetylglucosaminyltransferase 2 n=1 Tax=Lethenteron reissneri TaxID=7753 RepID=UPI002AB7D0E8|nr:protein O-linked-mannose beta-1,4-N-acetylglucosaminyltransferase 2 [Lethenteron reissneri]
MNVPMLLNGVLLPVLAAVLWQYVRVHERASQAEEELRAARASPLLSPADYTAALHELHALGTAAVCTGKVHTDRLCRFQRLCYWSDADEFVFFHGPGSVSLPSLGARRFQPALMDLSSVDDHNTQYFNFVDMPVSALGDLPQPVFLSDPALIFNRFNPGNIMHVLHDDLLPAFYTLRQFGELGNDARLVFSEGWSEGAHFDLYMLLTDRRPLLREDLARLGPLVCFPRAYVGVSKLVTWYQYGFTQPQGPKPNLLVSGNEVRHFADFIRERLNVSVPEFNFSEQNSANSGSQDSDCDKNSKTECTIASGEKPAETSPSSLGSTADHGQRSKSAENNPAGNAVTGHSVVLFRRTLNRLILNEAELIVALAQEFSTRVLVVSEESHSFPELVRILSGASALVGVHGSHLALAAFLPQGAALVEVFPYGVNPTHYTPYRTLCGLPGMGLVYAAWRNERRADSVAHPQRSWDEGGIAHLPPAEQERIERSAEVPPHLCCRNPEWLYRIYQDTRVNIPSFLATVRAALGDRPPSPSDAPAVPVMFPGRVRAARCEAVNRQDGGSQGTATSSAAGLLVSWEPPWNLPFLKVPSHEVRYEVWIQELGENTYTPYILPVLNHTFREHVRPHATYHVWVRCLLGEALQGPFAEALVCNA